MNWFDGAVVIMVAIGLRAAVVMCGGHGLTAMCCGHEYGNGCGDAEVMHGSIDSMITMYWFTDKAGLSRSVFTAWAWRKGWVIMGF
jgi:hypothetical protein